MSVYLPCRGLKSRLSLQIRADYNSQWIEGLAGLCAGLINVRKGKILTLLVTSCVSCLHHARRTSKDKKSSLIKISRSWEGRRVVTCTCWTNDVIMNGHELRRQCEERWTDSTWRFSRLQLAERPTTRTLGILINSCEDLSSAHTRNQADRETKRRSGT
jgi:hypothetical protein